MGIAIDLDLNQLSIPQHKLREITKCLAAAAGQTTITKTHMQSVIGYINHKVVRAARIFIARLLSALRTASGDVIRVTNHVRADLAWFSRFLATENARSIIPHSRTVLRIWADSSLKGGGATDGMRAYSYLYPHKTAAARHITQLEALNVLVAVRTFVDSTHAAGTIEVYGDNSASISAYSSGRARDPVLAACCRGMWFHAAKTQTNFIFTHMPGEAMALPDALSRAHQDPKHQALAATMERRAGISRVRADPAAFSYASFM